MNDESAEQAALEAALDDRQERIEILSREVALRDAEQALALADTQRRIEALETRVRELEREVDFARSESAAHARHIQAIYGTLSWRVTRPLRIVRRRVGAPVRAVPAAPVERRADLGAVLFVSGAPEVARRYRCLHQAEQLELLGAVVDTAVYGDVDLVGAADRYAAFVLHRVPWASDVEGLIERAHQAGRRVLFDSDDLVFEPAAIDSIAVLDELPEDERRLYIEGIDRFRRTLAACDGGTFSTGPLARHASTVNPNAEVAYNVASRAMVAQAGREPTLARAGGAVTVGYMSGTNTHNRDFLEVAPALLDVLERHRDVRLRVVGPLALDERFEPYEARIDRLPLQDWERLPDVQRGLDVNLAPLQPGSAFTESKSCVKWIEAGLVGVPTIATPTDDFRRVIEDGGNGLLASDEDEWRRALEALVADPDARRRIGSCARRDVEERWTTVAQAQTYRKTLSRLVGTGADRLTINWVMQSPIAQNSGGYRNIFRIANELGRRGHRQRFYIERVAHLAGLSRERVEQYVDDAFGLPEQAEIVLEHDGFAPADIAVATFWRTAAATARQRQSLFRAYFVQDFEPEFYETADPSYHAAAASYRLPLRLICLGEHLRSRLSEFTGFPAETVDFALDDRFRLFTPPEERGAPTRVLYFARPSLRRRGYPVGVEALRRLKERHPDVEIVFFGSPAAELGDVPFEFTDLGVLDADGVATAMNEAHILLTFSLTNISNVPFEGMACGCAVVDLDTPNVTSMVEADAYLPTAFDAGALADSLARLVEDQELRLRLARRGAETQAGRTWARTADMFEDVLLRTCFLRLGDPS